MAYYRLSQVIKMRREALGHSRHEYDADGPSFMAVYRTEEKGIRISEKNYRKLTRAMGEEESTRRGILKTKDIRVLHLVNDISNGFLQKDFEQIERLIAKLEKTVDCRIRRNKRYLAYVKAKLQYKRGELSDSEYEVSIKQGISYGDKDFEELVNKNWPYHEREWNQLLELVDVLRKEKDYETQNYLLDRMKSTLERDYMEKEYSTAYLVWVRCCISDALGNMGLHREALEIDEETCRLCEEMLEFRYMQEIYYDIFWNYQMIKKKETLTEQEEARCKECLLKAYYINKAGYQPKELYAKRIKECYPEELL